MQGPAAFTAGVLLEQEEHDQDQKCAGLLIAQPDLQRELDHGCSMKKRPLWPRAAASEKGGRSLVVTKSRRSVTMRRVLGHLTTCMPTRRGLPLRERPFGWLAEGSQFKTPNVLYHADKSVLR